MCTHPPISPPLSLFVEERGIIKLGCRAVSMWKLLEEIGLRSLLNGDLRSLLDLPTNETLVKSSSWTSATPSWLYCEGSIELIQLVHFQADFSFSVKTVPCCALVGVHPPAFWCWMYPKRSQRQVNLTTELDLKRYQFYSIHKVTVVTSLSTKSDCIFDWLRSCVISNQRTHYCFHLNNVWPPPIKRKQRGSKLKKHFFFW